MTLVVDASTVVAALVDTGPDGRWAEQLIFSDDLAAPHLMRVEAANILRRSAARDQITDETASAAHSDLLDLSVALYRYEPFSDRIWQLRHTLTAHDAWYVAIAEQLQAPLVTLDQRLDRAAGPRCAVITP